MNELPKPPDATSETAHRLFRDALTASGVDTNDPSQAGSSELHFLPQVLPHLQPPPGLIPKLVAEGADIEATDWAERTPLHYATQYGRNADLVEALLAAGADPHACDEDGQTPLHRAAAFSNTEEVLKALLSAGADPDARDERERTPLHLAAREGRLKAVTVLLAAHADIAARDEDGATPFHLAMARNDDAEVVAALESAGEMEHGRDKWGRTPMEDDLDKWGRAPRDYCRSLQTYAAGVLGTSPKSIERADILTFGLFRSVSRVSDMVRRFAALVVLVVVVYWFVNWPISWLAYWLVEDPSWRDTVRRSLSLLCSLWVVWRKRNLV